MCNHIRVKLLFKDSQIEPSWFSVNFDSCKTIADVEERIRSKFDVKTRAFKLMLADCRLPSWESVKLLREGDILQVADDKKFKQQRVVNSKNLNDADGAYSDNAVKCGNTSLDVSQDFRQPDNGTAALDMHNINDSKLSPKQSDAISDPDELNVPSDVASGESVPKKRKRKRKKKHSDVENSFDKAAKDSFVRDTTFRAPPARDLFVSDQPIIQRFNSHGSQNSHITFDEEELTTMEHQESQPPAREVTPSQPQEYSHYVEERSLPSGVPVYSRLKKKVKAFHHSQHENGCEVKSTNPGKEEDNALAKSEEDFNQFPDFHGPPCQGDKIAFRILEMLENLTPGYSKYKVAVVLSYDPISTMVDLKLHPSPESKLGKRSGELEATEDYVTCEQWSSLAQVKLLT